MPYRKRPSKRKYNAKRRTKSRAGKKNFRPAFARTLQIANLRPPTVMVKFQAKQRYLVTSTSPILVSNSVLSWNCSAGLKNPVVISGNWQAQRAGDIFAAADYQPYFDRYSTYKVLGTKISSTCRPTPLDGLGTQTNNFVSVVRSVNNIAFGASTPYYEIEGAFGAKTRSWGTLANTGYKEASIMQGYSPRKQLNLKDIQDNDELDVQTTAYGNNPAESTFQFLIIRPALVTASQGHMTVIVDVKFDVLAQFQDSTGVNNPLPA